MSGVKMEKMNDEKKNEQAQEAVKPVQEKGPEDALMGFYPIKDLPSRYKLYPEGTMIYGRPLRVLEVKQLSQMGETNSNLIMNNILKSATRGLKVEDILVADKIYIIFWLRANTYKDSGYKVDFNCLTCGQESSYAFNLDALQVTYLPDDYVDGVPIELPINKDKVTLRYQRICDVNETELLKNKSLGNPLVEYNDDILDTASCIVSVNGKELSLKAKYEYLIGLDAGDYAVLENPPKKEIGVSTIITVKCSKCGEQSPAGLSFRGDFFVPKYKT